MATLLPSAPDQYDRSNEQQTRRAVETRLLDQDTKLSSLLTTAGTLAMGLQDVTLAAASGPTYSDIAIGYATYVRVSGPTASFSITGFAGGETGRVLVLRNTTIYQMTIVSNATSTAANRILTPSGGNVVLDGSGNSSAVFVYDSTSERWVLVSVTHGGLVPGMQFYRLNAVNNGANVNTVQSIFGVGCTLSASTVYNFEIVFSLSKTAGVNAHTVALGFGGTATLNNIMFQVMGTTAAVAAGTTAAVSVVTRTSAASAAFTGSIATASTEVRFVIAGTVSVSAGGTFIPQYTLSAAPGGAYSTMAGSYMSIFPIGASGANTSIGTWA